MVVFSFNVFLEFTWKMKVEMMMMMMIMKRMDDDNEKMRV